MTEITKCLVDFFGNFGKYMDIKAQLIFPRDIIKTREGVLDIGNVQSYNRGNRKDTYIRNWQIVTEFLNEKGKEGWIPITTLDYEGFPYRGGIVFIKFFPKSHQSVEEDVVGFNSLKPSTEPQGHIDYREAKRMNIIKKKIHDEDENERQERIVEKKQENNQKLVDRRIVIDNSAKEREDYKPEIYTGSDGGQLGDFKVLDNSILTMMKGNYSHPEEEPFNDNSIDDFDLIDEDKSVMKKVEEFNLEEDFEKTFPGKRAVWQGKETLAFKEWKELRL